MVKIVAAIIAVLLFCLPLVAILGTGLVDNILCIVKRRLEIRLLRQQLSGKEVQQDA